MTVWAELRRKAQERHTELLAAAGGDPSASALLTAAAAITGFRAEPLPSGDPLLHSALAVLDREFSAVYYNRDSDPLMVPLYIAHEYAHFWLDHPDSSNCSAEALDVEAPEEPIPLGVHRVEGYGPEEAKERQANVFARELLLPSGTIRRWYLDEGLGADAIAARVGIPIGVVYHQLTHALLVPRTLPADNQHAAGPGIPELDPSQADAAHAESGPLLVEAGPGTGKTRTLIGRVLFLLGREVSPRGILCLTFSNKAAEEMRERIARVAPEAAPQIPMSTFHAFGLEILRRFGTRIGLPERPVILDPADALFLLERGLPDLRLKHYQNLYEPAMHLRDFLSAISRAKDEMCSPAHYQALAEGMLAAAATSEEVEAAEKALEVARVYGWYQGELERQHLLDFGDLIYRTVMLLWEHADVRDHLRAEHPHVLVDEYQDVNRASGLLLKEMVGDGRGLWVVGDTRQSIYRWRGASTANMRLFSADFPGASTKILKVNYRSRRAVIDVFAELAPKMRATLGQPFETWEAARMDADGRTLMEIAENHEAEAAGIAREIQRNRADGIAYKDQAVLCRSHTQLARLAAGLEAAGVPVFYLGDLFEREEIRDLLSLLSLACHGDGRALLRIACFPEYEIPLDDVTALLKAAKQREIPFPRALELAADLEELSERGRDGLLRLSADVDGLCYGSEAWGMLARYLFERRRYLVAYLQDESVGGQQKRLAIYQFLQFAHQQRGRDDSGQDPKRAFLRYVRRLEIFGEEKQLRHIPDWAASIEAVRLLTIHSSKGLEFPAVFLPSLGAGYFPASRQPDHCPTPVGLVESAGDPKEEHEEEEECLFFVALSRARDVLCLSRPVRYGKRNSNPSRLLNAIERRLPRAPGAAPTWLAEMVEVEPEPLPARPEPPQFDVNDLETYQRCPRQYLYEVKLGLSSRREDDAYVRFHRCVYDVLRWIQAEHAAGREPTRDAARARLGEAWDTLGPKDHPYADMYRERAEEMLERLMETVVLDGVPADLPKWEVPLERGVVRLSPDHASAGEGGAPRALRLRTGRASKKEMDKPIYGLYQAAFARTYPGQPLALEVLYLTTGERAPIAFAAGPLQTRLKKYNEAMEGILRRHFPPEGDDRMCPRCPHYFICPAAADL